MKMKKTDLLFWDVKGNFLEMRLSLELHPRSYAALVKLAEEFDGKDTGIPLSRLSRGVRKAAKPPKGTRFVSP
jgi:hypothetical protein